MVVLVEAMVAVEQVPMLMELEAVAVAMALLVLKVALSLKKFMVWYKELNNVKTS
jgi:hypothetical protein